MLSYTSTKRVSKAPVDGLAGEVYQQLMQYFDRCRTDFQVPLDIVGTPFQKSVWHQLAGIPFGKSLSYGNVAAKINSGPRAVGNACRDNPVTIIVPCHRVVGKFGLGGYSGSTTGKPIARKKWLLRHERIL